jgi:hypothetical protein
MRAKKAKVHPTKTIKCPSCGKRLNKARWFSHAEPCARLASQPEQAPILDLQLFYDQLVDGQIIKESDGEPWPLTKSEAKQIVDALFERLKVVWPLRIACSRFGSGSGDAV